MIDNGEWQIGHYTPSIFLLLAERSFYGLAIFFWGGGPFSEKNGGRGGKPFFLA
jgi:hypothetical protein